MAAMEVLRAAMVRTLLELAHRTAMAADEGADLASSMIESSEQARRFTQSFCSFPYYRDAFNEDNSRL